MKGTTTMKIDSFGSNVIAGFVLAILAATGFHLLSIFFPTFVALRLVISFVTLFYIAYLMLAINIKVGKFILPMFAIGCIALAQSIGVSLSGFIALHLFFIWFARAVYLYRPLGACLDGFGCLVSASLTYLVLVQTHSLFIAVWTFFLLQAVILSILPFPEKYLKRRKSCDSGDDKFLRAQRMAQAAFKRLNTTYRG